MKYKARLMLACASGCFMISITGIYLSGILSVTNEPDESDIVFHKRSQDIAEHPGISALRQWSHYAQKNETTAELTAEFLKKAKREKVIADVKDLNEVYSMWLEFKLLANIDQGTLSEITRSGSDSSVLEILLLSNFIERYLVIPRKTTADHVAPKSARDIDGSEVENANNDYQEPPSRWLSEESQLTLTSLIKNMNEIREPKNDLGERLDIHEIPANTSEDDVPAWRRFQNHMRRHMLYSSDDPSLQEVLHNMRTLPIVGMDTIPDSGTQSKFVFRLEDGSRVMSKPQRMPVDIETLTDVYQFDDFEKFYAEIASFHLDRILGFNRVPPVVSRYVNLISEVKQYAPRQLKKTFYDSPINNVCFYGVCSQFCDTPFGICGSPELIATSFAFYLPSRNSADRYSWENPWKQSYSRHHKAPWFEVDDYCTDILEDEFYQSTRRLLDIMDLAVFDFIQTNLDRHHFHTFDVFENDTNIFLYDNGRAFARSYRDEMGLLAPLIQCCRIRLSTLERLFKLYTDDVKLSDKLRRSLASESVQPLLTEKHLRAVDRRLVIVLETIYDCIAQTDGGYTDVVEDDGF